MKLSVSISAEDVQLLDDYAERHGLGSRSAAVQAAVRTLRSEALAQEYADEFAQWDDSEDKKAWDTASAAGLDDDAPR